MRLGDAVRLAVGTLTTVPVPAPRVIDRAVAGAAMVLGPVAAVPLAVVAGLIVAGGSALGLPALAVAALSLGAVALGSRGLHLDGLADTADGLGASYDREKALDVMRRGDSGPTGVATLVFTLLVQVGALTGAVTAGHGVAAVVIAVLAGRCTLSMSCARGVPPARPEGLGATVAGSVPVPAAVATGLLAAALAGLGLFGLGWSGVEWSGLGPVAGRLWWRGPVAVAAAYAAAALLLTRCVRRLGGITGDVLGAGVEVAVAAALLVLAPPM
ncbi:adenosylcobinamide-GDP ribazoletransferase [Amycolatopsis sp. PS_44_ISF1]|uniref:adenosylcobinamide-GDP ribazoletransferase n=1 Tax=Amycolatopsis sp. PS_44_ISF1 TaxID=2974917 RepID=UPI0028DE006E|nr:adenosylcobinamide-GDP ribazoletransferase [Amycolatopsis sp. PS_44_ISF1]MDT8912131.1 adenosylcobinamide-GDP ribazoletransferase [Amycolatopsis sp. PS_44_ISF1]